MPRRDSDSESDRGSHRRTIPKRTRKDSSSDSRDGDSDSSAARKHRHRSSRHSSRSRSRSREPRRREHKRSRSPKRISKHSRNTSVSRHNSRSRSRSSSRSRTRRNRRSRSSSRGAKGRSKRHRVSQSRSRSKSPKQKQSKSKPISLDKETDKLKRKVQQALKAAANADAELREKGLLSGESASTDFLSAPTTFFDQMRRVQTLEEINAPSFVQQTFLSSRSGSKAVPKTSEETEKEAHSLAIFGMGTPKVGTTSLSMDASMKKLETWKENPQMLIHQSLFADQEEKQERWVRRLLALRKKLLLGEG